jgi:DNA-binding ferritin-like protein
MQLAPTEHLEETLSKNLPNITNHFVYQSALKHPIGRYNLTHFTMKYMLGKLFQNQQILGVNVENISQNNQDVDDSIKDLMTGITTTHMTTLWLNIISSFTPWTLPSE